MEVRNDYIQVLKALHKRCTGYETTEEEYVYNPYIEEFELKSKKVKHIPPDVKACIWWVENMPKMQKKNDE